MAFRREWQRKLHEAGWAGISWPKEYGGRGATLIEQAIFVGEAARQEAPSPANVLGLAMGGPVVIAHGTDEQKQRYLEPILTGEEIWCQGFSEPESGSDLASLKTQRGQGRRRMGGHRAEGLDDLRPVREVVHARRPHRPRRPQAQGPHLLPDGHGAGGGRGQAAGPDHRRGRVQRGLHRGGADPRRQRRRRRRQRLDGRDHDPDERARRARLRRDRPDRQQPQAARRAGRRDPASTAAPRPRTRSSASGSPSSTSRPRRCGSTPTAA